MKPKFYNSIYCGYKCTYRCDSGCQKYGVVKLFGYVIRYGKLSQKGGRINYKQFNAAPQIAIATGRRLGKSIRVAKAFMDSIKSWPSSLRRQQCIEEHGL